MLTTTSEIILNLIYLISVLLIGGIIWYLINRSKSQKNSNCNIKPEVTNSLHVDKRDIKSKDIEKEIEDKDIKPKLLTEARDGGKDNLQLIKGIGKVLEKRLNDYGIYHFDQISNWTEDEAKWMDKYMSFPGRIARENWIGQSADLAKGKSTEFSERVEKGKVATSKKS